MNGHRKQSIMFVIVLVSFLLQSARSINSVSDTFDHFPDAWLELGGTEGAPDDFKYSDDPLIWRDLPNSGILDGHIDAQICVNGLFLLYGEPNFDVTEPENVKILSGENKCVPAISVASLQSGQAYGPIFRESLVLFPRKYLAGAAFTATHSVLDVNTKFSGTMESLLVIGSDGWTLLTSAGKYHCVKPAPNKKFKLPICAITDFGNNDIQLSVQSIYYGCAKDVPVLLIPDCVEFGGQDIEDFDQDGGENNDLGEDDDDGGDGDDGDGGGDLGDGNFHLECDKDKDFLQLLDMRIHDDLYAMYQMRFPQDKRQFNKAAQIISYMFDIAEFVCTGAYPTHFAKYYLKFFRETFIFLYEKFGKSIPEPSSIDPHEMNFHLIQDCADATMNSAKPTHYRAPYSMVLDALDPKDIEFDILGQTANISLDEVNNGLDEMSSESLDVTVELMYLVSNLVVSTCHSNLKGETDLWLDLYPYLNELLLEPLLEHWQNPQRFANYYEILMSGEPYEDSFKHIQRCAVGFGKIVGLDFYQRPFDTVQSSSKTAKNSHQTNKNDGAIYLDLENKKSSNTDKNNHQTNNNDGTVYLDLEKTKSSKTDDNNHQTNKIDGTIYLDLKNKK